MGEFILNGRNYGGSIITPNPSDTPTDSLNSIKIDDTTYEIQGGGGGSDVTITPTLSTGQKLADYSIDGTSGAIYMPTVASGDLIINPSEAPTDTLTKIGVSSSIEDAYLSNGKIATSAGYYITCPLDKTLVNGTYTVRVRDGSSEYNFEVTYSGSTITKSWSAGSNNYTLTITSTTARMSYYSGNYRNIYCDIVMLIPQMDVYDIEGGGGSNLILDAQRYSLEEQVVGIWTDGKPLYQKSFATTISTINTPVTMADVSGLDIDAIVDVEGYYRRFVQGVNDRIIYKFNTVQSSTISSWLRIVNKSNLQYQITNPTGDNSIITNQWATIQYTKTTDTAGGGGYQAYGFSPIIYSDTEREIGVWRDNKPLYQRTFVATSPSATDTTTSIITMPTGIENVVSLVGFINQSGAIAQENVNYYMWYRKSQNDIACRVTNTNWKSCPMFVTVRYTKLADVAGSGEYNTLAIPNVHYSTDEQVIGTWIDGKTLYQKTVTTGGGVPTGATLIEREVMESYDTIKYTKA